MKILHIANWYPTMKNPKRALWIRDQIFLTADIYDITVWHLEVENGPLAVYHEQISEKENSLVLSCPAKRWFIIEILTFVILCYLLFFKLRLKEFSYLHFHIAYPLLTYWHIVSRWVNKPIVVSEHWSAYHFDFNIKVKKKLRRIQRIFYNKFHLLTVSNALAMDIKRFSGNENLQYTVVPNIINLEVYQKSDQIVRKDSYFMLSQWKEPKDPFTIIELLGKLSWLKLRIGGYGPQLESIRGMVEELNVVDRVEFLGILDQKTIALEMNQSRGFIHSSKYETFSVVCAEAICCGCPVIASNVGGIKEFIDASNGILVSTALEWERALERFETLRFSREEISKAAKIKFDKKVIHRKLSSIYK